MGLRDPKRGVIALLKQHPMTLDALRERVEEASPELLAGLVREGMIHEGPDGRWVLGA